MTVLLKLELGEEKQTTPLWAAVVLATNSTTSFFLLHVSPFLGYGLTTSVLFASQK